MIVALIDNHGKMAHTVFVIVIYENAQTVYLLCTWYEAACTFNVYMFG